VVARAASIQDPDPRRTARGAAIDDQPIGGGGIGAEEGVEGEPAALADVVAGDGQAVSRAGGAVGQVDQAGIGDGGKLTGGEWLNRAVHAATGKQRAGGIDGEAACQRAGITQHQVAIEGHLRAIGESDCSPTASSVRRRG